MVVLSLAIPRSPTTKTAFAAHRDLAPMDSQYTHASMTSKLVTTPRSLEMTDAHDAHRELTTPKPSTHA